jgi:DNA-binding response OmpR family regulator
MPEPKRIGDRLVAAGLVSRPDAESAAVETVLQSLRLVSVLTRSGKLGEAEALRALSEQLGVPAVDLSRVVVDAETLARIPATVAQQHLVVPLIVEGSNLLLAMASPQQQSVIDEIRFATGLQVLPFVALHYRLLDAVRTYPPAGTPLRGANSEPDAVPGSSPVPIIADDAPPPPQQPQLGQEDELNFEVSVEDEPLELSDDVLIDRQTALESTAPSPQLPPTEAPTPAEPEVAPGPAAPDTQRTLLVVDDEEDIRTLVVNALEPLGHKIITASRGIEALHLVKSAKPDLLVLDAMLPEVHGFEICRKIKESERFAKTPVLMISAIYRGWRMAEDIKALYKVDAFLEKPFRINELRHTVQRLLANAPERNEVDPATTTAKTAYDAALAAAQREDFAGAFGHLRQAETLEPFSANIQFLLGRILEQQDRAFQAIYHYERAIELNPTLFPATKNLALLYQAKGFKNKAVEMWERSLRAAPSPEVREQIKQHLVSIL